MLAVAKSLEKSDRSTMARQASFSLILADLPLRSTQVVQLGTTDIAAALDFDRRDQRAVELESPLDAFAAGDLAHR